MRDRKKCRNQELQKSPVAMQASRSISKCLSSQLWHSSDAQTEDREAMMKFDTFQPFRDENCKEYISSYRKSQQKWLRELYNIYKNFIMTNEDNNHDIKYTNNNDTNNHDTRDLHK